jgi:hypothetical protein
MKNLLQTLYAVFLMLSLVHAAMAEIQRVDLKVEGMT